jgi:hypothetical protein
MTNPPPITPTFRWRWLVAGFLADLSGLFFIPAYNWTGHPVQTWLTLVIFPFGMLSDFAPLLKLPPLIYWFAPLLIYGLLLSFVPRKRLWFYSLAILHTAAAVIACVKYFKL